MNIYKADCAAQAAKQPKADCADDLKQELRKLLTPMFKNAAAMQPVMAAAGITDNYPTQKPACLLLLAGQLVDAYMA